MLAQLAESFGRVVVGFLAQVFGETNVHRRRRKCERLFIPMQEIENMFEMGRQSQNPSSQHPVLQPIRSHNNRDHDGQATK